jgi:hypothetical protein
MSEEATKNLSKVFQNNTYLSPGENPLLENDEETEHLEKTTFAQEKLNSKLLLKLTK